MNIPDEAVEAAHKQLEAMGVYLAKDEAEAALYAAAPHLIQHLRDRAASCRQELA